MGEVVEFNPTRNGDLAFMACPCTEEPTPYMVVAIAQDEPIICALVCPECQRQLEIVNGIVVNEPSNR